MVVLHQTGIGGLTLLAAGEEHDSGRHGLARPDLQLPDQ